MSKFEGKLDGSGILFTILAMVWFTWMIALYGAKAYHIGFDAMAFPIYFIFFIGAFVIALPYISACVSFNNSDLQGFLRIPDEQEKITFPVISNFLSEQALGAFLGTTLIVTTAASFKSYSSLVSAFYCFVLFAISIFLVSFSLLRFAAFFRKFSKPIQFISMLGIVLTAHLFYEVGLMLGEKSI